MERAVLALLEVKKMLGLLSGDLFLLGIEENIIPAKKEGETDSTWYRLKFGDGVKDFSCTCGKSWKCEVEPGKVQEFMPGMLHLFQKYRCYFDVDMSTGNAKLKLRAFRLSDTQQNANREPERKSKANS